MDIIYEDSDLLVINKPAGLVVDRGREPPGWEKYFVVHRLDRDTSGLLVLAKNLKTLEKLQEQFQKRTVKKKYLALVHGRPRPPAGIIRKPVGRNPKETKKFAVVGGGREAMTRYRVVKTSADYSLLEIEPLTGRTHQVRIHLKSIGHPVVGDRFYSSRRQLREAGNLWGEASTKIRTERRPRQFLHAQSLGFTHPRTGEWMRCEVDLPEDLKSVLDQLSELNYG